MAQIRSSFFRSTNGSIAVLTALVMLVILFAAGSAIDYTRYANFQDKIQQASDGAALATIKARAVGDSERISRRIGRAFFEENIPSTSLYRRVRPTITFFSDTDGIGAQVRTTTAMPTTLTQLMGIASLPVEVISEARVDAQDLEISLVLDVSISMAGARIRSLKAAAEEFVNLIDPIDNPAETRVMNLIPFSNRVRIGNRYSDWVDPTIPGIPYRGCLDALPNYYDMRDDVPAPRLPHLSPVEERFIPYKDIRNARHGVFHCPPVRSSVTLFSDRAAAMINKIRDMELGFGTGTDHGLLWGWRALSPKWRPYFKRNRGKFPLDHSSNGKKIIILLTDGRLFKLNWNTTFTDHRRETENTSVSRFNQICANLDSDNSIEVYTIGFNLGTASARMRSTLQNCASNGGSYFDADISTIRSVFQSIFNQLIEPRLSG